MHFQTAIGDSFELLICTQSHQLFQLRGDTSLVLVLSLAWATVCPEKKKKKWSVEKLVSWALCVSLCKRKERLIKPCALHHLFMLLFSQCGYGTH